LASDNNSGQRVCSRQCVRKASMPGQTLREIQY
ncbi:unnamed protein product, partial [Tuber aestivum]